MAKATHKNIKTPAKLSILILVGVITWKNTKK